MGTYESTKTLAVKQLRASVWPHACCFNLQLFIGLGSENEQAD